MAFTMMATAGAAYTDQADIEATEAVEMLATLGIMTGDGDGSFRPNDTITRAEACRMIYSIRTGSDNADAYADMQTTFTDVPSDAWYAGYVKHCQSVGIVSGKSATIFDPNADVTTVELALMCLRVMGYDPAKADIGGSTWSITTVGLATEAGILDDVNASTTAACPRQWAAQLMYNMIDANTVRWSDDANGYTDTNLVGQYYETVGEKYLSLYTDIGTVVAIDGSEMTISISKEDAPDCYHDGYDANNGYQGSNQTFTKMAQDYTEFLGQRVKVMFKDGKLNSVIGVYAMDDNNTYVVNAKDVESDGNKVKFDGTSYTLDGAGAANTIEVWGVDVNGDASPAGTGNDGDVYDQNSKYFDNGDQAAVSYTFVDNDGDGKLEYAIATEAIAAKVTYASSSQIVAGGTTYKFADENIDDSLAKDDWAVISYNRYDECLDIVKADVMSDTLTRTKTSSGVDQYEIGGNWYNVANTDANTTADINTVTAGDTVEAVAVNGILFYVKRTSSSANGEISDVALVLNKDNTLSGDQVNLAFFDGSKKVVDLDSDSTISFDDLQAGAVYEYTVSGNEYSFESLKADEDYYGDFTYMVNGKTNSDHDSVVGTVAGANRTYTVDDNATVMLYAGNDRKMITGKQFKNLAGNNATAVASKSVYAFSGDVNGLTRVGALAITVGSLTAFDSLTTNDNYGYIMDDATVAGRNSISYPIWTGSEMIVVTEDKSNTNERAQGTIIGYKSIDTENNNLIEDVDVKKNIKVGRIDSVSGDTLSVVAMENRRVTDWTVTAVNDELDVTNSTTVLFVNSDNDFDEKAENGNIGVPTGDSYSFDDSIYPNILYIDDGEDFELVVFDVAGEFTNSPYVADRDDENEQTMTVATNDGTTWSGSAITATVELTTANIADGANVTMAAPAGITLQSAATVNSNSVTATLDIADTVNAGTYKVTFTCGDVSVSADVEVKQKTETATVEKVSGSVSDLDVTMADIGTLTANNVTLTFRDSSEGTNTSVTVTSIDAYDSGKYVLHFGEVTVATGDYFTVAINTTNVKVDATSGEAAD